METLQVILDARQINQKIKRIAIQIVEQNFDEQYIILAGIQEEGLRLAKRLKDEIEKTGRLTCGLLKIRLDKSAMTQPVVELDPPNVDFNCKVVVIVDDVINSGRTLIYAVAPFLVRPIKKLQVAVLVHRTHKAFPIAADYVGLSLATTIENSIRVTLADPDKQMAYLV